MQGTAKRIQKTSSLAPVKVTLRVRPTLPSERSHRAAFVRVLDSCNVSIPNPRMIAEDLTYTFDRVWDGDSQEAIFAECEEIVAGVLAGVNATIFAYGMTGAGKTFSMLGSVTSPGIVPRTVQTLLQTSQQKRLNLTLRASFLEIYNEKVFDLIAHDSITANGLDLREDANRNIYVAGISEVLVDNYPDFERTLSSAIKNRATAATKLNEHSSRSHFVTLLTATVKTPLSDGSFQTFSAKLNLIDLAGSEDNKRTGNTGLRMVESGSINKSLFVLGQCVEALNKGQMRVPYRDSKMTRLLQDSLGGKAKAMIIACVGSQEEYANDTYNTLNFAAKSKLIVNKVEVNEEIERTRKIPSRSGDEEQVDLDRNGKRERGNDSDQGAKEIKGRAKRARQGWLGEAQREPVGKGSENSGSIWSSGGGKGELPTTIREQMKDIAKTALAELIGSSGSTVPGSVANLHRYHPPRDTSLSDVTNLLETDNVRHARRPKLGKVHQENGVEELVGKRGVDGEDDIASEEGQVVRIDLGKIKQTLLLVLNSGDEAKIKKLKGIGNKRALQILEYWKENGNFHQVADLTDAGFSKPFVDTLIKSNLGLDVL
ncbi:kinesin-domain-containing protein [Gonapodya prolifera JEL478]|uniref:Kinesin-like protein n=1 Tax=Gonapodya prolifera (strain JEL478) TaxID=1344416 RepID=A0A139A5I0_GONPJ|nr:kinesin-domain-containing protein [Gonapodya prolifera JEL478]|eukprot:KXS12050.1 kinesin-domain-containing protein [Gonapodya prolifera JEL478]